MEEEKELSALELMDQLENGVVQEEDTTSTEENSVDDYEDTENNEDESETESEDGETSTEADGAEDGTTESEEEETEAEEGSEDSQVDGDDSKPAEGEDETENEDSGDDSDGETEEIDYRKKYEELTSENGEFSKYKSVYEELSKDFKANGRVVKGITDPEVIRMNMQKGLNYDRKMAQLKPAKPIFEVAAKRGWIDDPAKLNRLLDIEDGNVEALKALVKEKGIDILDHDFDEIDYTQSEEFKLPQTGVIDDLIDQADILGIQEEVSTVLNSWDDKGLVELDDDPERASILMKQIGDGTYNKVMDVIDELAAKDYMFSKRDSMSQYVAASHELKRRNDQEAYSKSIEAAKSTKDTRISRELELEKEKLAMEAEYKAKLAALENEKIDKQREKATRVSKPKGATTSKKTTKEVDASTLSGDAFMKYFNSMAESDD